MPYGRPEGGTSVRESALHSRQAKEPPGMYTEERRSEEAQSRCREIGSSWVG